MSNYLEKIEPHAKRLDDISDKLDAAGIGGHPTRGHAAILRDMARHMRADASLGKIPHVYNAPGSEFGALSASEDNGADQGAWTSTRKSAPSATRARPGRRVLTCLEVLQAKGAAAAPSIRLLQAMGRRLGYDLPFDEPVDLIELDRAIRANKSSSLDDRFRFKSCLAQEGLL
jgi:hypothetical protein